MFMKKNIIILHGWGLNGSKYSQLTKILEEKGYKVYSPDLPGFGHEPLKSDRTNLDDYVSFLEYFIKKNKIQSPILIGHSFGGRVALKYSWRNKNVSKLILTGVPLIRNLSFKKKIQFIAARYLGKTLNVLPKNKKQFIRKIFYFMIGEWDYYNSGKLKEVFKNIIGEDLIGYIKNLNTPTVLVWGEDDKITPVYLIKKINKIKKDIKFLVVPGIGHKLPYENANLFYEKIKLYL